VKPGLIKKIGKGNESNEFANNDARSELAGITKMALGLIFSVGKASRYHADETS
jgi:hypothetical protein